MPFLIQLHYPDSLTEWYKGGSYQLAGERYLIVGPYTEAKRYPTKNKAAAALKVLEKYTANYSNFYSGDVVEVKE